MEPGLSANPSAAFMLPWGHPGGPVPYCTPSALLRLLVPTLGQGPATTSQDAPVLPQLHRTVLCL